MAKSKTDHRGPGLWMHAEPAAPRRCIAAATATAGDVVQALRDGSRVTGLSKGQMSLLDLIEAVLGLTGPASVTMSFWTMSMLSVERFGWLMAERRVTRLRVLVDQSFPRRAPQHADGIEDKWGPGAIVLGWTHAKFAVVRGAERCIVIRTSANLNRNPRFETFDLDDSPDLGAFFEGVVEELVDMGATWERDTSRITKQLEQSLGGGMRDDYPAPARGLEDTMSAWRARVGR